MPRYSKQVKEVGEKNSASMLKYNNFNAWQRKHLKVKDRLDDYEKAFNYIHRGAGDAEEDSEPRSVDADDNLSSL